MYRGMPEYEVPEKNESGTDDGRPASAGGGQHFHDSGISQDSGGKRI